MDLTHCWIVIDGKDFRTGKPLESRRFGPFASEEEAAQAEPDLLPWDAHDYVYRVHIETILEADNPGE